jgi:hypothetical protein
MKYALLIHSDPQPWGHPTSDFNRRYHELPEQQRHDLNANWQAVFSEAQARGEILDGWALGSPESARIFEFREVPQVADGPYAHGGVHLAGIFLIDVESAERAEEIAASFSCPGDVIELRPLY